MYNIINLKNDFLGRFLNSKNRPFGTHLVRLATRMVEMGTILSFKIFNNEKNPSTLKLGFEPNSYEAVDVDVYNFSPFND